MLVKTAEEMETLGREIGATLRGGEVIELIGDVGAGKTTFTRGLALGLGITSPITSPSFTISCCYPARDELSLNHYDFYRLSNPGVVAMELAESISDPRAITVIEWGESIQDVLPKNHIIIRINYMPDVGRTVEISGYDYSTTEN